MAAVDERIRRMISDSLVRAHGEEVADGMMALLGPADWDQVATKEYLDHRLMVVEARMGERLERSLRRHSYMVFVAILGSPAISKLVDRYSTLFS